MAGTNPTGGSMLSEINVTPLVDVMLVLLIIFMVTAPMINQAVDVDLPQAEAKALNTDDKKLTLQISGAGEIHLGRTFVPWSKLADKLKFNEKLKVDKELYLEADRKLPYGLVVKIMAMAKAAGIDKVNLVTEVGEGPEKGLEEPVTQRKQREGGSGE